MKQLKRLSFIGAGCLMAAIGTLSSCNKESDSETYLDPSNLAVTGFSLQSDLGDQELDTVFFSIDLQRRVIFNADSLRKGTDVSKVVANITFSSTVSSAVIEMSGGTTREGEIDYQENPTDSIDFTGNVVLRVKAEDDQIGTSYRIKVNVHNLDTDTIFWSEGAVRKLPARLPNPRKQKTVQCGDKAVTLIEESDGTFTRAETATPGTGEWTGVQTTFPFVPDLESLAATDDALWILSEEGNLYTSDTQWSSWSDTGETWTTMIGAYTQTVVGLKNVEGKTVFTQYPLTDCVEEQVPADFPVSGGSNFVTLVNKWTLSPVAFFTGGRTAAGNLSASTWAFDGANWIKLSTGGIPAVEEAALIPYYNYRASAEGNSMVQYKVWMLMGGRLADGTFNRTVYVSYDNGVNWDTGVESLQLPAEIPAMTRFDNIVSDTEMTADLSDAWKTKLKVATRTDWEVSGDIIKWECPYIYLFGGYAPDGTLYNTVWRGVLSRLTFTPII